ncbi:2-oxoacid:acceptor oxidoreductase family protein [uncultured Tyzzerella sp.]|uniref:2-oxoacid:acceptor oxidoreductase family protein n=1 Tax=uncultured Tyzzerella sp. TaxID=2321398 RepID=UPI002943B123|nr:2-oxoacid:acceptor oxidoreductase family protein [uncultured Tyzzerella sp.]
MSFKKDYFEIRLESIGGLGANLAGKILGEYGALYLGLNASSFSSYGSEKRGSPVKAYIRYAKENIPIRVNSPVQTPDILGIFHIALADKENVMAGVSENTAVVVNTDKEADEVRDILKMYGGKLYCVDALNIALETKSRVNMVMLGAIAKTNDFMCIEKLEQAIKDTIGKKYPKALEQNLNAIRRGYENVKCKEIKPDDKYDYIVAKDIERAWGYKNAPIGGINPCFGSSISNDISASREGYVPIFIKDKCINCGLCDSTCPDIAFQFVKGEYKGKESMVNLGIDYHHCKGCMRCTQICPTNALEPKLEKDVNIFKQHIRNKDLIVDKLDFEKVGASSFVTSESYKEDTNI